MGNTLTGGDWGLRRGGAGKVSWGQGEGQLCKWETCAWEAAVGHRVRKVGVTGRKCDLVGDGGEPRNTKL